MNGREKEKRATYRWEKDHDERATSHAQASVAKRQKDQFMEKIGWLTRRGLVGGFCLYGDIEVTVVNTKNPQKWGFFYNPNAAIAFSIAS